MTRVNLSEQPTIAIAGDGAALFQRDAVADMAEVNVGGWQEICARDAIPRLGARVVKSAHGNIAIFRTADDEVFALADKCPHRGGPLSQGIVFGRHVACPLHNWSIGLADGQAVAPDAGCAQRFETKVENGVVLLKI